MGGACAQGTASGTLTLNQDTFELKYAAAMRVPDFFDKTKKATRVVLTDKPIPGELVEEEAEVWDLKSQGIHGLEITVGDDKNMLNLFVISSTLEGSLSVSKSIDPKVFSVFTDKRIEGAITQTEDSLGSNKFSYSFKFGTDLTPPAAQPTAADATAAQAMNSTKAYLALVQAIRTGNKQALMDLSPPDRRAMIDTPDFPKMLELVQLMTPQNIKVLKATESGDRATLIVRGIQEAKPQRGKVTLTRMNGKWIVTQESWKAE
jgi:hypothetical protein